MFVFGFDTVFTFFFGFLLFRFRFNGLFAPHWRSDARGTLVGLTQYTTREHICRATLEAVAFQVYEILLAMEKDSGHRLKALLVDGGMTKNDLLMQIQADFNGTFPLLRIPRRTRCTQKDTISSKRERYSLSVFVAILCCKMEFWESIDLNIS